MKCTVMAFKALSVYWMKLVIKRPAELHTACGFKPYTVVVYSVHSWVCWVMLLSHRVHCKYPFSQWDLCLGDEYFPNGRKGQIRKTNFFSFFSTNRSRFSLILPVSLHWGGGGVWTVLSKSRARGGQCSMRESAGNNDVVGLQWWGGWTFCWSNWITLRRDRKCHKVYECSMYELQAKLQRHLSSMWGHLKMSTRT